MSRVERIGDCTLYLGWCEDVLPGLLGIDAVLFDPPYGIGHSSMGGPRGLASWQGTQIANDGDTATRDYIMVWAGSRPTACFGTWKVEPYPGARGCLIWDKGPAFGMGDLSFPWKPSFETLHIYGKGWAGERSEGVLRGPVVVSWESKGRTHPHEKPVWLFEHLIKKLPRDAVIVDPTMGSGTSAVACAKLNRAFIGIESDPGHYQTAVDRVTAAYRQSDLFLAAPAAKPVQQDMPL